MFIVLTTMNVIYCRFVPVRIYNILNVIEVGGNRALYPDTTWARLQVFLTIFNFEVCSNLFMGRRAMNQYSTLW